MSGRLHILVMEDEEPIRILIDRIVTPLRAAFPECVVTMTTSRAEAHAILAKCPTPDVAVFDLRTPQDTVLQTIADLAVVEKVCPVVVITGHATEQQMREIADMGIEVIEKRGLGFGAMLVRAIARAIDRGFRARHAALEANIARIREIVTLLTHDDAPACQ